MKEIHKKAFPALFAEVASGRKTFDLRLADFDCQPGDVLVLDEVSETDKKPTGRSVRKKVGYVLKTKDLDFFAQEDIDAHGYQVMSLLNEDEAAGPSDSFAELRKRALEIRQKYNALNSHDGHDTWGGKEYAMGFVGDVGQLLKIVMAKENLRNMDDVDAKLKHELSDCLWSVFVLASHYDIDLRKEFLHTMDQLEERTANA